jgi:hypothetical protein
LVSARAYARAVVAATVTGARLASADPPASRPADALRFRADRLDGDAAAGDVTLKGNVELAYDRYRLRAERLHLRFQDRAIVFTGEARAALCPCPDAPLTFLASGGRFEPPGDLVLHYPRLAIAGVPVFALPVLWLRSPEQIGVLPPIVAVRGGDGLLLGSGVHLPWRGPGGVLEALDLTAGGYVAGGAEVGAHLATAGSDTSITMDLIHGTRVALLGRGALVAEGPRAASGASVGVAWSLDAIRGDRARSGTVDLEPAARPFDAGAAEVSVRAESSNLTSLVAGGVVARAARGEGPIAAGPRAALAFGGRLGTLGSWGADATGVVLGDETHALSIGRASARAEIDAQPGPFELRASAGARARFAGDGGLAGPSTEEATAARADLELPFARAFASGPGDAPLVHWITPALSVRGALAAQGGPFFVPIGGSVPTASWIGVAGVSTALGRYAGPSIRLDLRAGATGAADGAQALLHAHLGADARLVAAAVEAAAVGERVGSVRNEVPVASAGAAPGASVLGRVRVGDLAGPWMRVDAAGQTGAGAGRARAIAWGAWAALPGDDLAYLAAAGWTGGAELSIPWGFGIRTGVRADMDLDAKTLLAIRGTAGYRHPCGCFGLGVLAAHRVGRDGVDVAVSLDVAPPVPPVPARR